MQPQTNLLLNVFEDYRMPPTAIDQYNTGGKDILASKMESFTSRGAPLEFVMLGFPFKSTNIRDKVLGALPDLGEQLTLRNFASFNEDIKKVYSPGVNISIASDGYIFSDLLNVPDNTVAEYGEISADMGAYAPMKWFNLYDFYKGSTAREKIMQHFAPSQQKLEEDILMNPDVNFLYRGMKHFMMEELADKSFESKGARERAAKKLVREMMLRNEAWSNLVRKEFSNHIRLSMHPSVNNGYKYSFQLIKEGTHSAWHCAIYMDSNGKAHTMHKKDAEQMGLHLITKDNRPYYFTD